MNDLLYRCSYLKANRSLQTFHITSLNVPRNRGVFCDGNRDCPSTIKQIFDEYVETDGQEPVYHVADECNPACRKLNITDDEGCYQPAKIDDNIALAINLTKRFTLQCSEVRETLSCLLGYIY